MLAVLPQLTIVSRVDVHVDANYVQVPAAFQHMNPIAGWGNAQISQHILASV